MPDNDSPSTKYKSFSYAVYGCYIGALLSLLLAIKHQVHFNREGYIHIGNGIFASGYIDVYGEAARYNIAAYWFAAIAFFVIAAAFHIKAYYSAKGETL